MAQIWQNPSSARITLGANLSTRRPRKGKPQYEISNVLSLVSSGNNYSHRSDGELRMRLKPLILKQKGAFLNRLIAAGAGREVTAFAWHGACHCRANPKPSLLPARFVSQLPLNAEVAPRNILKIRSNEDAVFDFCFCRRVSTCWSLRRDVWLAASGGTYADTDMARTSPRCAASERAGDRHER